MRTSAGLAAVAGVAVAGYAAEGDVQVQAATMRAKLARDDRSPPSGFEIPGPTFYSRDANGTLHPYAHQGDTSNPVRFWTDQGHSGSGTAVGGSAP
jgi:hypothetical protein